VPGKVLHGHGPCSIMPCFDQRDRYITIRIYIHIHVYVCMYMSMSISISVIIYHACLVKVLDGACRIVPRFDREIDINIYMDIHMYVYMYIDS